MGLKPLVDGDILVYEIGFACVTGWKAMKGEDWDVQSSPPPFDYVAELLENRIADICGQVMATEPPTIYLTGEGNFRESIAQKKGYKANRKDVPKPFHYANIRAYMQGRWDTIIIHGMEADDAMCIEQCKHLGENRFYTTIICSRDKDLRQCPGMHFGWELGNQPQFGPELVSGYGYLKLSKDKKTLKGVGEKFFYAQLIMGDPTDNIPGIPKSGAIAAFKLLDGTQTSEEGFKAVVGAYRGFYGESWRAELLEQGQLLWMVRELDQEGNPIMWKLPNEDIFNL